MLIGRIERGFDFLGYHFSPTGLRVATQTIANFIEKASRLYEQERSAVLAAAVLEMYVRRWFRWIWAGLGKHSWLKDHEDNRPVPRPSAGTARRRLPSSGLWDGPEDIRRMSDMWVILGDKNIGRG
jgi:hypothetical protein